MPDSENLEEENEPLEVPVEEGDSTTNTGRAEAENLLNRLLYKGVLPRYAFPTDVATFYVFDNARSTYYRKIFEYAPSQGLTTALTQYAPGKDIWIDGRLWTSGAIYSPIAGERYRSWENRRLYFECSSCQFACTEALLEGQRGERRDCPACRSGSSFGPAKVWVRPPGFAHPSYIPPVTAPEDQPARSYATRAKLTTQAGSETEWNIINGHLKLYSTREHLLVTNRGPRNEGYTYCARCGAIEPTAMPNRTATGMHEKPFPDDRDPNCPGGRTSSGIVLGTDFPSDILLISVTVEHPVALRPGLLCTEAALRTLCEALSFASTQLLRLEAGEIQAEFRPALTEGGSTGLEAEIYLYDTLPGGAGFSPRVGRFEMELFNRALSILECCPADCDRSCYRCLRSYKNKFEHDLLDRKLAAELLRYLIFDENPQLSRDREETSTNKLFEDLMRQSIPGVEVSRNFSIDVPGIGSVCAPILLSTEGEDRVIVAVNHPLTSQYLSDPILSEVQETSGDVQVFLADELLITRNLPAVSSRIMDEISV